MPKTPKRLTRRERQEKFGKGPAGKPPTAESKHIHCMACGRHIEPEEFTMTPLKASWVTCQHGSRFASCERCIPEAQARLNEHDRTGQPPRIAAVWH
jgi:hypothetical protein